MRRSSAAAAAIVVFGMGAAGCGSEDRYENRPRPPAPIVISASVDENRVSVSPDRIGAGPITLVVTNQTDASQELRLETDEIGASEGGIQQETGPINPSDTASLKANVPEGTYKVSVGSDSIRAAALEVGPERPSSQDELLLP